MNYLLFDHATYDRLYNCSMMSPHEWEAKKRPNMVGVVHMSLASIYQTFYIIFLCTMLKDHFWQHSCYKMMFMLGVYDVCATFIGGTLCGSFSIRGDIFCTNQTMVYVVGCWQAAFWAGACMTGLILLINRALDLIDKKYANLLFKGWKTYVWLVFPFVLCLYIAFFTTPFLFNAILDASFLSPYLGIPEIDVDMKVYDNRVVAIHNYVVAGIYPFMYLFLCIMLCVKTRGGHAQESVSSLQKQIIAQSIIVSAVLALTAVCYMFMQYYPVPEWFYLGTHFIWQASHGASVFTYLFVNKSMRKEAILLIKTTFYKIRGRSPDFVNIDRMNPVSVHVNPTWLGKLSRSGRSVSAQETMAQ